MSLAVYEEFHDDVESVPDDVLLFRRVDWDKIGGKSRSPKGVHAQLNGNCFTDWPDQKAREAGYPGPCMSVGVSIVLDQHGRHPSAMLEDLSEYGLAFVTAGALRNLVRADGTACPQGIMLCPTEREPWHGVVFDLESRPRPKSVQKSIAKVAGWIIPLINHDG